MLEQKEIIARTVGDFATAVYNIAGVELNNKQARMILAAAVTSPMRSLFTIAEEQQVPVSELSVALPYGKVEIVESEAKTGAPGEEKKTLLDENGNPIMKNRLKIKLSKGIAEEVLSKTGWSDEEVINSVNERLAKEEKALAEFAEINRVNETWLASEELRDLIMPAIVKYMNNRFGIDLDEELASFELEEATEETTEENAVETAADSTEPADVEETTEDNTEAVDEETENDDEI